MSSNPIAADFPKEIEVATAECILIQESEAENDLLLTAPNPVSTVPDPVSTVPDPVSTVPDSVSTVPDPVLTVPDPVSTVPDPVSTAPIVKTRKFYLGDVVIKKSIPTHSQGIPIFGTVTKPPVNTDTADGGSSKDRIPRVGNMTGCQVSLVDRSLRRNMKVGNEQGAIGNLSTVQIIGTKHVVERVTLDRLRPIISDFERGQEILYNNWIGVVTCINRKIWFMLDGGWWRFYVESIENDGFVTNVPYGCSICVSSSAIKTAKWVSKTMKFFSKWIPSLSLMHLYSKGQCTINKIEVTGLEVFWLQVRPGLLGAETMQKPETSLSQDKLVLVTCIGTPSSETVGINSVGMLKLRPEDSLTTYPDWLEAFIKTYVVETEKVEAKRISTSSIPPLKALAAERVFEIPVKVLYRQSIADIDWNDGDLESIHSIKSPFLVPMTDDSEYPQGMVVARLYDDSQLVDSYGIVLDNNELMSRHTRKINVKWISNGTVESTKEESILDLRPHPTYSLYQRGTILFPRNPHSVSFKSAVVADLDIGAGKMVVVVTADNSQHEVFPHMVTPILKHCVWNPSARKWTVDEIVPPPYQISCEFHPAQHYAHVTEPTPEILTPESKPLTLTGLWDERGYKILEYAPETHCYHKIRATHFFGFDTIFRQTIVKELNALKEPNSIPEGIWVRCYENRIDLLSVLMLGPSGTPFEDGIFMFDLHLPYSFPLKPPMIHYVSYTYEISPMLSSDGNFCVGALDWVFPEEPASYVVNCISQMQGILFAAEPYFSDGRSPSDKNTERGKEFSRLYNEETFLRVLDSTWNMIYKPHEPWTTLIKSHFTSILPEKLSVIEKWNLFEDGNSHDTDCETDETTHPKFPLIPISEGLKEPLMKRLEKFRKIAPMNLPVTVSGRNSKTELITDSTADSESVPVDGTDPPIEILEMEACNADDIIIRLCYPDGTSFPVNDQLTDGQASGKPGINSQKNLIKGKGHRKKPSKKDKKGHSQKNKSGSSPGPLASASVASYSESEVERSEIPDILEEGVDF